MALKLFLAHVIYYFAMEMELEKESIRIARKKPTQIGEFLFFETMEAMPLLETYMDHIVLSYVLLSYSGAYMV